jgi:hypothetical protein
MTLHIARGNEKLGPYEFADVQGLIGSGTLRATDLAWHAGLPGWIPLRQVPGLTFPASGRPALVWVICGLYLAYAAWVLFVEVRFFLLVPKLTTPTAGTNVHVNYAGMAFGMVLLAARLAGTVLLFLLRRSALYFLGATFAVSFLLTACTMMGWYGHASYPLLLMVQMAVRWAVDLMVLAYVWHLFRSGVLR